MALPRADRTANAASLNHSDAPVDPRPAAEAPPSFENFVAGSNAEALTGLAAWLAPANRESLFFLWGEAGAGKSHLLQACQAAYCDARLDPELSACRRRTNDFYAVDNVEALGEAGRSCSST
jgi:DnaA family protein